MLRLLSLLSFFVLSKASSDPSTWIESFDVDAYACDLDHEPINGASFQAGDFARICVHTISDNSDIVVQGLRYFVFVEEEAPRLEDAAFQLSENHGQVASMACSEDNMCVIETVLQEGLFDNETPKFFGYGALVLGRSGPERPYDQFEDVPIQITLSTGDTIGEDQAPNLQGKSPTTQKFLRGTKQNA